MRSLAWMTIAALGSMGLVGTACVSGPSEADDSTGVGGVTASGSAPASGGKGGGGKDNAGGSSTGGKATSGGADGVPSGGSSGGEGGFAGGSSMGGDPTVCCLAVAVCDPEDEQIDSLGDCPEGETCYRNAICCSEVFCVDRSPATCLAIPVCNEDETEVKACPKEGVCEERTLCGTTIYCVPSDASCSPKEEYNREYKLDSPAECQAAKFECPFDTEYFANDCGCGCEQSGCPALFDCRPPEPHQLCQTDRCPYTERVGG
jgi:hypothetical protein